MSTLKGSFVPPPKVIVSPISRQLHESSDFSNLQTYYPGMGIVCELPKIPKEDIWFDHGYRVINVRNAKNGRSCPVTLQIERNEEKQDRDIQDISGFRKVTHLLDPVTWIQGKYSIPKQPILPGHSETWGPVNAKLQDPMNQAYIEALATYSFSRLREADHTPHFHRFFGAFCSVAKKYSYNITDSYMSYRHKRWFWDAQEKTVFSIGFDDEDIPEEVRKAVAEKPSDLYESDDEDSGEEELDTKELHCQIDEAGSIRSADLSDMDTVKTKESKGKSTVEDSSYEGDNEDDDEEDDEDEDDEEDEEDDELNIYAEINNFPVMCIYTEASEGTMDDLLDNFEQVGAKPGTKSWDQRWRAWVFQVIAALCVGQSILGFTHNDLHSNNIVWSKTDEEYLYYSCRDGLHFRVPTFGKIFRLIDFGRSIFKINQNLFFSDDFRPGNDAAEQFNFGELYDPNEEEVHPNPSFDLSRFTVSVFEGIFPSSPPIKKKPATLSQEKGLKMLETESELYNLMWTWLLCDDGHNVLMEPDGKERYPDFELYKVITAQVHDAIPSQQVKKSVFEDFRMKKKAIPVNAKIYSLFC